MRIICNCGNEMEFKINNKSEYNGEGIQVNQQRDKFELVGEHDEVWITCKKCNKIIHMWS